MSLKHLVATAALTLAVATCGGFSQLAAHAAPSAGTARPASADGCGSVVLQQTPANNHLTIHGYLYLMRSTCDGYLFLRMSTDLWGSTVSEGLSMPNFSVWNMQVLTWGGHVDTAEVPYTSGATYYYTGNVSGFWGDDYWGEGTYTAP
jgi:hypothetical protein